MQGGTRKRGSTWSYYFDMGKVDGKRQKKEKGGFATKKEAEAALAKAINEYNTAGHVFEPSEITVSDYLDQWFDLYCKPNLKYNTQVGYLRILEGHLKPKFGSYRLRAISSALLQEYANDLKMDGLSKSHVTGILSVFGSALDYAVEPLHYLSANPMRYVKVPKDREKATRTNYSYLRGLATYYRTFSGKLPFPHSPDDWFLYWSANFRSICPYLG